MNKTKVISFIAIASLLIFIGGIDVITSPLNASYLKNGAINNFSININGVNDTLKLYANNNLIYSNSYSSKGLYSIPIFINTNQSKIFITLYTSANAVNTTYTYYISQNSFLQKLYNFMGIYQYWLIAVIIASILIFLRIHKVFTIIGIFVSFIGLTLIFSISNIVNYDLYLMLILYNFVIAFYGIFSLF